MIFNYADKIMKVMEATLGQLGTLASIATSTFYLWSRNRRLLGVMFVLTPLRITLSELMAAVRTARRARPSTRICMLVGSLFRCESM